MTYTLDPDASSTVYAIHLPSGENCASRSTADVKIYTMRTDGSDVKRLTDDQFEEGTPSWIPLMRSR